MINFSGQSIIVTGADRGLGRLYAEEITRRGGTVVVSDPECWLSPLIETE